MKIFVDDRSRDKEIYDWICTAIPGNHNHELTIAFANEVDGKFVAGSSLIDFNGINVYIQLRVDKPFGMSMKFIKRTFDHAFNILKAKRITSIIEGSNIESMKITQNFGFKLEGVLEGATSLEENIYISVLYPKYCKYLEEK